MPQRNPKAAAEAAMTRVLDAELRPDGKPVDLAGLFARAVLTGACAVKGSVGDTDTDELVELVSAALPDVGFDWDDALAEGFPDDLEALEEDLQEVIRYEDRVLDSLLDENVGTPQWVGGVSPNPYSRMACSLRVLAITWKDAVWFFETGDFDGMDQYYAQYAYTVGDEFGEQSALIDIARSWAGGELCDHPDPEVRSAARRAYLDAKFEAPWHDEGSGWAELIADDADDLVWSYGQELASAMDITAEQAERLIRSVRTFGPGEDPDVDNTAAALELWWQTDNWTTWWG